jgi:hypothetical protein
MLMRVADWHGEQAAICYQKWVRSNEEADLRDYCRHAIISKRMWKLVNKLA